MKPEKAVVSLSDTVVEYVSGESIKSQQLSTP